MRRILKIGGIILAVALIGGIWFVNSPADIKPSYLGNKISDKDFVKGKTLLKEMQAAHGGMDNWLAHKTGRFVQLVGSPDVTYGFSLERRK